MDYPYDLGSYSRKVTTASADAQRWFDRGLNWCFGYHHEEAIACFEKALQADPNCAMAHWGVAYAAGPNYNFPWELSGPRGARPRRCSCCAHDACRAGVALIGGVTAAERALIEALPIRFPQRDPIDDQRPWNDAFASDAMRLVHRAHPDDLDLRCIFAEAILNRTPWQMWDLRTGEPAPGAGTLEAREVLEAAFRDLPGAMNHPGLLHLHVHLMKRCRRIRRRRWSPATGCGKCPPTWATWCTCLPTSTSNAATTATRCTGTRRRSSRTASSTTVPGQ